MIAMSEKRTTIGVKESTKRKLESLKEASDADTWDEFADMYANKTLDVSLEELEIEEAETHERIEQTRATVVGVLEAVDEAGMTDEIVGIIKSLSEQNMLAQNQDIVEHLMEKSRRGEPLNDIDQLLAQVVMETENSREGGKSPAAEIARGLFSSKDQTTAERTQTKRDETIQSASVSDNKMEPAEEEIFDGVEMAEDESPTVKTEMTVVDEEM